MDALVDRQRWYRGSPTSHSSSCSRTTTFTVVALVALRLTGDDAASEHFSAVHSLPSRIWLHPQTGVRSRQPYLFFFLPSLHRKCQLSPSHLIRAIRRRRPGHIFRVAKHPARRSGRTQAERHRVQARREAMGSEQENRRHRKTLPRYRRNRFPPGVQVSFHH